MKLKLIKRYLIVILLAMIWFDFFLHFTELVGVYWDIIGFSFKSRDFYTIFWTIFWGLALILINIILLIELGEPDGRKNK